MIFLQFYRFNVTGSYNKILNIYQQSIVKPLQNLIVCHLVEGSISEPTATGAFLAVGVVGTA